ncbi:MAG: polysaccharide lyase 6 family protein [Vicinamibacterales bacterium]
MTSRAILFGSSVVVASLLCAATASATTYTVNSLSDLQTRIDNAVPGDVIIVHNGVYTSTASITIRSQGTATDPIRIVAESVGGAEITGARGFEVSSPAAYVEIEGFLLTHSSGRNQIRSGATHIRFTRNFFECTGDGAYLTVAGHDAQVDLNEFRNKSTVGNMIDVRGSGSQIAQRVWIHHNYFHDFTSPGENGAETIRFGLSGLSLSKGFGVIEHNLFVRATGENEMLSIKASGNTIRYNTLLDSPGAQLTLRHGNENLVYGNYLRRTDGIRIFGDRHQVFSNYLEANTGGINIGNGDGEVADGAPLTSHDRPDDCVITFNTLVNNARNYYMTGRTNGLGATNTVFANNILQGGGSGASLNGLYSAGVWSGNIIWQTADAGAVPAGTYDMVDPQLEARANGVFRPKSGSPAVDSAIGDYPAVTVDMDGQPRSGSKDTGADEVSSDPVVATLLAPGDLLGLIHGRTPQSAQ